MTDVDYARKRAREERDRAARATSPEIRRVHLEFATRYEQRAAQDSGGRPDLRLV